jgi:hypothetical protein
MYKVITVEYWKGHIAESEYSFNNALHMYKFIHMCEQDGIKWELVRNKKSNEQKGA